MTANTTPTDETAAAPVYENVQQLAERWGVTPQHIYRLMARGLPSVRIGRARRFNLAEVEAWLRSENEHDREAS